MPPRRKYRLHLPSRVLVLGERSLVMGVLNVTPDSFSDGGIYAGTDDAVAHAFALERAGADILDIGGESTRPGSRSVTAARQLERILPVLKKLRGKLKIPISVDTSDPGVAEAAIGAGAEMLNDVRGLRTGPALALIARRGKVPIILMHMRGEPATMQKKPFARNVMADVIRGLRGATETAMDAGLAKSQIVVDPGFGFGKSFAQNYELLARISEVAELGFPILAGTSRKGFIGRALEGARSQERLWGTAATVTASILGGAHIVRVHDVREMVQVARVADAILDARV